MGIGVSQPKVEAVRHLPLKGDCAPVIHAGRRALKYIDRTELRERPGQRIYTRGEGQVSEDENCHVENVSADP